MKHKLIPVAIVIALLLMWGCGPTYPEDLADITYPVPEFSDAQLSYNTLRQELHCELMVMYDEPIAELNAELTLTGFDITTLELTLNDSALNGDALRYDHIFSRNISLNRIDSINGSISVKYDILDSGVVILSYFDTLNVIANLPPVITEITMPDTIVRPLTGTKALLIYLEVDDPNGVYDVINAYFQVQSNSTGQWGSDYSLNDTGTLGDVSSGDGIFSTGLQIFSTNLAVTNYFRFRVKDTASNFSDWSLDSVVVR